MKKAILVIIIIITTAFNASSYSHLSTKGQKALLNKAIRDIEESTSKEMPVFINSEILSNSTAGRILKYYLSGQGKSSSKRKFNVKPFSIIEIDSTYSTKSTISIMKDQSRFDSLAYLFWLVKYSNPVHFTGMSDSVQMQELKKNTIVDYITVQLATPYYWKNYALVSFKLGDQHNYVLYQFVSGNWKKKKYVIDPR